MKILYIFALLLSVHAFAQCKDSDKVLLEVKEIPYSNILIFPVDGDPGNDMYPNISNIIRYANSAMAGAETYIKERSGAAFQKQCKARYIYVQYPDWVDVDSTTLDLYMIPNYDVTYIVEYAWKFGNFSYDFDISLDKDYRVMASEEKLPSKAKNPDPNKFIDVCKALKVVKSQKQYKGVIGSIGIKYDSELDMFCWQVEEHPAKISTTGDYPVKDYYVNFNTGNLESVEEGEMFFVQPEKEPAKVKPKAKAKTSKTKKKKK